MSLLVAMHPTPVVLIDKGVALVALDTRCLPTEICGANSARNVQ